MAPACTAGQTPLGTHCWKVAGAAGTLPYLMCTHHKLKSLDLKVLLIGDWVASWDGKQIPQLEGGQQKGSDRQTALTVLAPPPPPPLPSHLRQVDDVALRYVFTEVLQLLPSNLSHEVWESIIGPLLWGRRGSDSSAMVVCVGVCVCMCVCVCVCVRACVQVC